MKQFPIALFCALLAFTATAQHDAASTDAPGQKAAANIYTIRQAIQADPELQPGLKEKDADEDGRMRFDRWYHEVATRAYPSGELPPPDAVMHAYQEERQSARLATLARQTGNNPVWQPLGPLTVPNNYNGIGRVNCIAINPKDSNTLYIGSAGGGLFISHDGGLTWPVHSDDFPSMSVAAIAVNPVHPDTLYAATGDGYGYEVTIYNVFWGGLYSAGIIKSTDGGQTWAVTGFSLQQSGREIVQSLLIHPTKTKVLLAGTRHGIYRTADAGVTWQQVDTGQVYSMAFRPQRPDTVYAAGDANLRVSYNAGLTWQTLYANINSYNPDIRKRRATIAVSPASPRAIWVLNNADELRISHNDGLSFGPPILPSGTNYYGYYDRVLAVSPADSSQIISCGSYIARSLNGGGSWNAMDPAQFVHVDYHAALFSPVNASKIYVCNDGGVFRTTNGGQTWQNLSNNLNIAQIYRMSSSRQDPHKLLCGLQDNSTFSFDGTNWSVNIGGDGEACAISAKDDQIQIGSYQHGNFFRSVDGGGTFTPLGLNGGNADWTAPVAFSPNSSDTIYFGLKFIYVTRDGGNTFTMLPGASFAVGATCLTVAPSDKNVLYTADQQRIYGSVNSGGTWTDITGNLPTDSVAITRIAVDFKKPNLVYVTTSGYKGGKKVFYSSTGGSTWINISGNLPNIPANCIAVDSSVKGRLFVGTDMGIYFTDSAAGNSWAHYGTGLPNVIINDLDLNYPANSIRVATYGRGIWEASLKDQLSIAGPPAPPARCPVQLYPNPAGRFWHLYFPDGEPDRYRVTVTDISGRNVFSGDNIDQVDVSGLSQGTYLMDVVIKDQHFQLKGIRE